MALRINCEPFLGLYGFRVCLYSEGEDLCIGNGGILDVIDDYFSDIGPQDVDCDVIIGQ